MQYLTIRDTFHRWLNCYAPSNSSVAHQTYRRLYMDLIDAAVGTSLSGVLSQEDAQRRLRDEALAKGIESASAGLHALHQAMAWADIWPVEQVIYEHFNSRSSIEIPLSSYQIAELVTKLPVNYRVPCHILLLTGIKASLLSSITMASFKRTYENADEPGCQAHIHPIYVQNHPQPIYLTNPVLSSMNKYIGKNVDSERVFSMAANAITMTWNRYADDAPMLGRFKGTAATHLLRLGADSHIISANLGINLSAAESIIERLRPSKLHAGREAFA